MQPAMGQGPINRCSTHRDSTDAARRLSTIGVNQTGGSPLLICVSHGPFIP